MAEVLMQLLHLEAGVLHDAFDLMTLRGSETQLAIHPLDHVSAGHAQNPVAIRERACGEANQQPTNERGREYRPFEPIRQSRNPSIECPRSPARPSVRAG